MSRPRSILVCLPLILIQLLSPWVHAHTGCETGGLLHIPGLERLRASEAGPTAQADLYAADTLVGVQSGIENSSYRLGKLLDSDDGVFLSLPLLAGSSPLVLSIRKNIAGNGLPRLNPRSGPPPRAPPTGIHL
jgi:hypothetical protein